MKAPSKVDMTQELSSADLELPAGGLPPPPRHADTRDRAGERNAEALAVVPVAGAPAGVSSPPLAADGTRGRRPAQGAPQPLDRAALDARLGPPSWELIALIEAELRRKPEGARAARLYFELGRLQEERLKDWQAAAKSYESALKLAPDAVLALRGARRVELALGRLPTAARLLERETQLQTRPKHRAAICIERARVLGERLDRRPEARGILSQAAELTPHALPVLKLLARAHEEALDWEALATTLGGIAAALDGEPAARAAYLAHQGRVLALRCKDVPRAIEAYKQALACDPTTAGVRSSLQQLLFESGRFSEWVVVMEQEAALATEAGERAQTLLGIAQVQMERLALPDAALATLQRAKELAPDDLLLLEHLTRAYEAQGRYSELAQTLEQRLALEPMPRATERYRLARLYEERLGRYEEAIAHYREAALSEGGHTPSTRALERLYAAQGQWHSLAELLAATVRLAGDDERPRLLFRVGEVCERHLGAISHALANYRQALSADPDHVGAYAALCRLYASEQDWHALIELLERRLEREMAPEERVATLFRIGRIEEDTLLAPARALRTYQRLVAFTPTHLEALVSVQRTAERAGEYALWLQALEAEAALFVGTPRQLGLLHRASEVAADYLGESARAADMLEALTEEHPAYRPALESLVRICALERDATRLVSAYRKLLAIERDEQQRASLLLRIGETLELELERPEAALPFYRQAGQAAPGDTEIFAALGRVLTKTKGYKELCQVLERCAARHLAPEVGAQHWLEAGQIHEAQLDDVDRAIACYSKALALLPALRPASAGVQRLLEKSKDYKALAQHLAEQTEAAALPDARTELLYRQGELLRDHQKQLTTALALFERTAVERGDVASWLALERLLIQVGDKERLADVYRRQAEQLTEPGLRMSAYRSWLVLTEDEPKTQASELIRVCQAMLDLEPDDIATLWSLERLALSDGEPELLRQVEVRLSEAAFDPATTALHQTRLGELLEAQQEVDLALALYQAALRGEGDNLAAARGISRLAAARRDVQLLLVAAANEQKLLHSPKEAARLYVLAARELASGGERVGASKWFAEALELDPTNLEAADGLLVLHPPGDPSSDGFLLDAMSRAAVSATASGARCEMWMKVATLHKERTGDTGAAIAAALRVVREEPDRVEARRFLAQLYEATGRYKDSASQWQELLQRRPTDALRLEALVRLAVVQTDRLDKPAPAESHIRAALRLAPDNREALAVLLRIQLAREEVADAAGTAQQLAELAATSEEKAVAILQTARIEAHQGHFQEALDAYSEAVCILGFSEGAAEELADFLRRTGGTDGWAAYCAALEKHVQRTTAGDAARSKAWIAIGRVQFEHLEQRQAGLKSLGRALKAQPEDDALQLEIATKLEAMGSLAQAAELYLQLSLRNPSRAEYWRCLAGCCERQGAVESARRALSWPVALGQATPDEVRRYRAGCGQPRINGPQLIAEWVALLETEQPVSGPFSSFVQAVEPALAKLYPAPFETLGLSRAERVGAQEGLRRLATRVASWVGLSAFELYIHEHLDKSEVIVGLGEPIALFIHRRLSQASEREQACALIAPMFNAARGLAPLDALGRSALSEIIVGVGRSFEKDFEPGFHERLEPEVAYRRLQKAMPWFSGSRLDAAGRAILGTDLAGWLESVQASALRLSAVATEDWALVLGRARGAETPAGVLRAVMAFAFGDKVTELTRHLGQ